MFSLPLPFLGVKRPVGTAGTLNPEDQVYIDLLKTELPRSSSAGIIVVGLIPGMVPKFEEESARLKAGYTIPEWRLLDWVDRAIEVAMFRLQNAIDNIQAEEAEAKSKRSTRKS